MREKFLPVQFHGVAAFMVIGYLGLIAGIPVPLLSLFNINRAAADIVGLSDEQWARHLAGE